MKLNRHLWSWFNFILVANDKQDAILKLNEHLVHDNEEGIDPPPNSLFDYACQLGWLDRGADRETDVADALSILPPDHGIAIPEDAFPEYYKDYKPSGTYLTVYVSNAREWAKQLPNDMLIKIKE